jgi:hypothetical protein
LVIKKYVVIFQVVDIAKFSWGLLYSFDCIFKAIIEKVESIILQRAFYIRVEYLRNIEIRDVSLAWKIKELKSLEVS